MGINFGYHHDERYIEDIHPAEGDGFDVREPRVRRQAIGALDERYTRFRSFLGHASAPDEGTIIPVKVYPKYTRIPPLKTIDEPIQSSQRTGSWTAVWQVTRRTLAAGTASALAFAAGTRQALSPKGRYWLAEKYSLARGVYADWRTRILTWLKWAILPLALAVGLFFLFAMPLEQGTNTPGKSPSTQKPAQKSPKPTTSPGVSSAKPNSASTGTTPNNPATASSPPPSTNTYVDPPPATSHTVAPDPAPSTPAPSGTSNIGSGPSGSQPLSSSSSSGLIPNTTVTVPPMKATISGKPLVNASGTSLSLN